MSPDHDTHQSLCDRALMLHRVHIPECRSQQCSQGRKHCPCPDTCRTEPEGWAGYFAAVAFVAACAVVMVLFFTPPGI